MLKKITLFISLACFLVYCQLPQNAYTTYGSPKQLGEIVVILDTIQAPPQQIAATLHSVHTPALLKQTWQLDTLYHLNYVHIADYQLFMKDFNNELWLIPKQKLADWVQKKYITAAQAQQLKSQNILVLPFDKASGKQVLMLLYDNIPDLQSKLVQYQDKIGSAWAETELLRQDAFIAFHEPLQKYLRKQYKHEFSLNIPIGFDINHESKDSVVLTAPKLYPYLRLVIKPIALDNFMAKETEVKQQCFFWYYGKKFYLCSQPNLKVTQFISQGKNKQAFYITWHFVGKAQDRSKAFRLVQIMAN